MTDIADRAVRVLLDKQAITEVVLRYCRGVDRLDMALVRSCYHDPIRLVHGSRPYVPLRALRGSGWGGVMVLTFCGSVCGQTSPGADHACWAATGVSCGV